MDLKHCARFALLTLICVTGLAHAAITFVGSGTEAAANNANVTPTLHASHAANDVNLVVAAYNSTAGTTSVSGYTQLEVVDQSGRYFAIYCKVDGGAEGDPTVAVAGGSAGDAIIARVFTIRGALLDCANIEAHVASAFGAGDETIEYPALTVTTANTFVAIAYQFNQWNATPPTDDTPAGFTDTVVKGTTLGGDASLNLKYQIQTTATNIAAGTITRTLGAAAAWAAIVISLKEASSCSGTPTITDVDTDESLTATQADFTITGTTFCATQGTGTVTLRQSGNSKTISGCTWSDTSLTGCDMSGVGMGVVSGLLYGAMDIRVTNDATNFDDQAITVTAPSGTAYTDLDTPVSLTWDSYGNYSRLHGGSSAADPTAASQCARRNLVTLSALTINADASITATGTGTFDLGCTDNTGSAGSELYVADYSAHPNCQSGSTIVCTVGVQGTPPLPTTAITDHVLAVSLAMTSYDVDDYFLQGEAASSARAMRQLGTATDTTADISGAHTNASVWTVTNATAHASLVKDAWARCGAGGAPVQLLYVDPVNNKLGLRAQRSCSDLDAVFTYANNAGSVSGVTVTSATGAVAGTPDTDATTASLLYRWTDAGGLIAETLAPFQIDVVTVSDQTANNRATAVTNLEAIGGLGVSYSYTCSLAEALDEVLSQQSSSVLWGTNVALTVADPCLGSAYRQFGIDLRIGQ